MQPVIASVLASRKQNRTPSQIVDAYLSAFYAGDHQTARTLVAENFAFHGPFLKIEGADAFFAGAQGLRRVVRGHRTLRQWEDGEDVSTLCEVSLQTPAGNGSVLMSESNVVFEGWVSSGLVVFDTAAFRALVPQAGSGRS